MREHPWFPSPFEPHGASNGNPSLRKPTSNLEVQFRQPEEFRTEHPLYAGLPLIDRALPQAEQLFTTSRIETMSDHGIFPLKFAATPGFVLSSLALVR